MKQTAASSTSRTIRLFLLSTSAINRSTSAFISCTTKSTVTTNTFYAATGTTATGTLPLSGRQSFTKTPTTLNMSWSDTWNDILRGGNPRWKIISEKSHEKALAQFERYIGVADHSSKTAPTAPSYVFCPLAGDDPIIHRLWKRGYSVTSIDLVPAAVESMRDQFDDGAEGSWIESRPDDDDGTSTVWTHGSGRATLYVGDALRSRPELRKKFDAVYDKDSFGALSKEMRSGYCKRIGEYCKKGAILYVEVKLKDDHEEVKGIGPPYSLTKEDLMEDGCYGSSFEYVEGLGSVYDLPMPGMEQTGHILRKK